MALKNGDDNKEIEDLDAFSTLMDIENAKLEVLKTIGIKDEDSRRFLEKLTGYKLVETIDDVEYGLFTRMIKLDNVETIDDIKVQNIGIAVNCFESYSSKYDRMRVLFRFKLGNRFNNVAFDDCFMFQKMRDDDQMIAQLIDYLREQ